MQQLHTWGWLAGEGGAENSIVALSGARACSEPQNGDDKQIENKNATVGACLVFKSGDGKGTEEKHVSNCGMD
jgi:hypothetical protein